MYNHIKKTGLSIKLSAFSSLQKWSTFLFSENSKYCVQNERITNGKGQQNFKQIMKNEINPLVENLQNDAMGFLNEIQLEFPNALSLASGRPDENFFDVNKMHHYFKIYTNYISKNKKKKNIINSLGQYNKSKGIINDIVAIYLKKQYGIKVHPNNILINVGTQESIMLALMCMCDKETDVVAVENPTYVGITDYSKITGHTIQPIKISDDGLCLIDLKHQILNNKKKGKRIKLVYVTPDFQNPTGTCMPIENRKGLLKMAEEFDFYIIEDNAYGDFVIEGKKQPTLKSIDKKQRVIYLHSLSKIIYPSLRIGIMVADQVLSNGVIISDLLSKIKGYTTVNTPSITQAIFAGILLENNFNLQIYNERKIKNLSLKREAILKALNKYFINANENWSNKISWNKPRGGFFLSLKIPIAISKEDVYECAKNYNIIFTPMSFFYIDVGGEKEIRLAYSYIPLQKINESIKNLSQFLKLKIKKWNLTTH